MTGAAFRQAPGFARTSLLHGLLFIWPLPLQSAVGISTLRAVVHHAAAATSPAEFAKGCAKGNATIGCRIGDSVQSVNSSNSSSPGHSSSSRSGSSNSSRRRRRQKSHGSEVGKDRRSTQEINCMNCSIAVPSELATPVPGVPAAPATSSVNVEAIAFQRQNFDASRIVEALDEVNFTVDQCFMGSVHPHTVLCGLGTAILLAVWLLTVGWIANSTLGERLRLLWSSGSYWETGPSKERRPHLDNAKMFLMFLVVLTHCHVATKGWRWNIPIHLFMNPFCTRTFGFISGICSQESPSLRSFRGLVFRLIVPLVLFCGIIEPVVLPVVETGRFLSWRRYTIRVELNLTLAEAGATWYMFALICWRIWGWFLQPLTPLWRLTASFVFASLAGYVELSTFKLHQAIPSFPVFVLGQVFPYEMTLSHVPYSRETFTFGVVSLCGFYMFGCLHGGEALLRDLPYWSWAGEGHVFDKQQEVCGGLESALIWVRALFRTVFEMTKCFIFLFAVCPRGRVPVISDLGAHTLYPFLLHYAFATGLNRWLRVPAEGVALSIAGWLLLWVVTFAATAALVLVLATPPVRTVFSVFLEPVWLERLVAADIANHRPSSERRAPSTSMISAPAVPTKLSLRLQAAASFSLGSGRSRSKGSCTGGAESCPPTLPAAEGEPPVGGAADPQ